MSWNEVGKHAKSNGIMPPSAIRRTMPADKPTPKVAGSKSRKRFGFATEFCIGPTRHEYRSWFATAARRDQAMAAARKQDNKTIYVVGPVERD